jgi:hypothetical protein
MANQKNQHDQNDEEVQSHSDAKTEGDIEEYWAGTKDIKPLPLPTLPPGNEKARQERTVPHRDQPLVEQPPVNPD